jgi:hypothetical protein
MSINSFVYSDQNNFLAAYKVRLVDDGNKELVLSFTSQNTFSFTLNLMNDKDKLKKSIWCTSLSNLIFSADQTNRHPTYLYAELTDKCKASHKLNKITQVKYVFKM